MRAILVAAVLLAAGCVSVSRPYPEKELYALDAGHPAVRHPGRGVLRVSPVRVVSPWDGASFVYRTGELRCEPDYYRGFVAGPEKLLTAEAVRYLGEAGASGSVVEARIDVPSACSLETTVLELSGDYRDKEAPRALVRARFTLLEDGPESPRLLGEWVLEASVPLAAKDAPALARALGIAWGEVLGKLVTELERSESARRPA